MFNLHPHPAPPLEESPRLELHPLLEESPCVDSSSPEVLPPVVVDPPVEVDPLLGIIVPPPEVAPRGAAPLDKSQRKPLSFKQKLLYLIKTVRYLQPIRIGHRTCKIDIVMQIGSR